MVKKHTENYLENYLLLLNNFVGHRIVASEFERRFLEIHRIDTSNYSKNVHKVISILFSDVDSYCSNLEIKDENDLDDLGLWNRAKVALTEIRKLTNDSNEDVRK